MELFKKDKILDPSMEDTAWLSWGGGKPEFSNSARSTLWNHRNPEGDSQQYPAGLFILYFGARSNILANFMFSNRVLFLLQQYWFQIKFQLFFTYSSMCK